MFGCRVDCGTVLSLAVVLGLGPYRGWLAVPRLDRAALGYRISPGRELSLPAWMLFT
jgi:hypothetical protein